MKNKLKFAGRIFRHSGQRGSALMLVLAIVVILGLTAGIAGQSWKSLMQRAREAELLWRGQQYRQAIGHYYQLKRGAAGAYPATLEELVRDPRFPQPVRHIRQLYKDPMTGEDWTLVKGAGDRIIGVRSSSNLKPFKQDDFPKELEAFNDKESYREWEFIYTPGTAKSKNVPSATPPAKSAAGSAQQ